MVVFVGATEPTLTTQCGHWVTRSVVTVGLGDLSAQQHTTEPWALPFWPILYRSTRWSKVWPKTHMQCGNHKEIQINPEYCNLGGKEKGNKSHSIEFCSLLIQLWAFPVWELKSVILSYLWVLPGWGFFGSSHSLSYIPIAGFIYFWFSSFHTCFCGTADELCIFYSWCHRNEMWGWSHSVTAQFWFTILGVLKNLNLFWKRWEWM